MNHVARHSSPRPADVESALAHAQSLVVPLVLWALALAAIVAISLLLGVPDDAPAVSASPEDLPVVALGT